MRFSEALTEGFTHYGLFAGLIPIYYKETDNSLGVRWWVPEFALDFAEFMVGLIVDFKLRMDPTYEPTYPILLTEEIGPKG